MFLFSEDFFKTSNSSKSDQSSRNELGGIFNIIFVLDEIDSKLKESPERNKRNKIIPKMATARVKQTREMCRRIENAKEFLMLVENVLCSRAQ